MNKITLLLFFQIVFFISCKKYLEVKQNKKLVVPSALADFQALLDDDINTTNSTPGLLDLGSDEYYLTYPVYQAYDPRVRAIYTWESDIWQGLSDNNEWSAGKLPKKEYG